MCVKSVDPTIVYFNEALSFFKMIISETFSLSLYWTSNPQILPSTPRYSQVLPNTSKYYFKERDVSCKPEVLSHLVTGNLDQKRSMSILNGDTPAHEARFPRGLATRSNTETCLKTNSGLLSLKAFCQRREQRGQRCAVLPRGRRHPACQTEASRFGSERVAEKQSVSLPPPGYKFRGSLSTYV